MDESGTIGFWRRYAERFSGFYTSESLIDTLFRQGIKLREQRLSNVIESMPGAKVLDLGCGPGRQVIDAINRGASLAVGVDAAPEMLDIAGEATREAGVRDRVELHLKDIFEYRDERKYDLVWALGVFDYMPDPDKLVQVMANYSSNMIAASFRRIWVLRYPIRKLTYHLRKCPVFFNTKGQIVSLFERNGLKEVNVEKVDPAVYFATGKV